MAVSLPPRSRLACLRRANAFIWATGIEDTFIVDPCRATGRTLDEYELTDHYDRWPEDLHLMAELGVSAARYGIPWHRVNPSPGRWEWDWLDRVLGRFRELGIDPIVDLVHYGTPRWMANALLNPDFPARMAEYAAQVARRYQTQLRWYTPFNEPRIAAWYCGMLGWWPPYRRRWAGFVQVLLAACRAIAQTVRALRATDEESVCVHVDATDLYVTNEPDLMPEVDHRQRLVFLALDLLTGRVDANHLLHAWLLRHGASAEELDSFHRQPISLDVVGLNMYPMFTLKELWRDRERIRVRMRYGTEAMVTRLVELYWQRFQRPMLITETAALGSVRRRLNWLETSVAAVRSVRGRGIPLVGYTWWPLYDLVAWAYRQRTRPLKHYLLPMGLWSIDARLDGRLDRVPTALVEAYCALTSAGAKRAGPLVRPAK